MPYYSRRYLQEPGRKWFLLYMFIPVLLVACLFKKVEMIMEKKYIDKCSHVCLSLDERQQNCCVSVCMDTFYKRK